jgi:hypothetical protein
MAAAIIRGNARPSRGQHLQIRMTNDVSDSQVIGRTIRCIGCAEVTVQRTVERPPDHWLRAQSATERGLCGNCHAYVPYWDKGGWESLARDSHPLSVPRSAPCEPPLYEFRASSGFSVCPEWAGRTAKFIARIAEVVGNEIMLVCRAYQIGASHRIAVDLTGNPGSLQMTLAVAGHRNLPRPEDVRPGAHLEFAVIDALDAMCLVAYLAQRLTASVDLRLMLHGWKPA